MTSINLTDLQKERLIGQLQTLFSTEFDETLSDFRADQILGLMLRTLGPEVYNAAVQDARAYFQSKLDDMDGEVYIAPD